MNVGAVIGVSMAASISFFVLLAALFYLCATGNGEMASYGEIACEESVVNEIISGGKSPVVVSETALLPVFSRRVGSPVKDKDAPLPDLPQEKDAQYLPSKEGACLPQQLGTRHVAELLK